MELVRGLDKMFLPCLSHVGCIDSFRCTCSVLYYYFIVQQLSNEPCGMYSFHCACSVPYYCFIVQQLLNEEISVLKEKVEHHPDVTRFAMENLELRGKKNEK